jgi:Ca2+-binding EF-hand superfamily protein
MLGYSANIHATPSERDLTARVSEASRRAWKDEYDRDIARRRERAGKLRAIERAQDILRVQESKMYSPWGRGGGGAPLRDKDGEVISDLTHVYNAKRLPDAPPLSPPGPDRKGHGKSHGKSHDKSHGKDRSPPSATSSEASKARKEVLLDALEQRLQERHRSIREAFLSVDRDRSGHIDVNEIRRLCRLYNLQSDQVNGVLATCDVDANGLISYDEFCNSLVRLEYNGEHGSMVASASRLGFGVDASSSSSSSSPPPGARRRQLRKGGTSPTTLSPPFRVELSGGRAPIGPSDDGTNQLLDRHGAATNSSPTFSSSSSSPTLWPKKLSHSPTSGKDGKGASFYVPAPPTPDRQMATRRRNQLIKDLDAQVQERKMARENAEYQELRKTLLSQQRLVEQGRDHWGQPVPEGDPRGTLRLMAINTLNKLQAIGVDPGSTHATAGHSGSPRIFDSTSFGGGSGPRGHGQTRGAMPFMGALASMNGRSPEEKRRDERQRHKLQQSLKHQVNVKKNAATIKEIEELRLLLKSRQAKLDKGADHWGQRIPPNDPFGVRRQMVSDQESILNNIRDKQAQVEAFAKVTQNNADYAPAAAVATRYVNEETSPTYGGGGAGGGGGGGGAYDTPSKYRLGGAGAVDFDEDLDRMVRSMSGTKRAAGMPTTFESTALGQALSSSPSRDPASFNDLGSVHLGGGGDGSGDGGRAGGNSLVMSRVDSIERKLQDAIRKAMMTETAMRHLFVQFDKIGAGKISKSDFCRGFDKLAIDATEEEVDSLVRRLDKNGDGYIDYLEFVRISVRGSHNVRRWKKQQQQQEQHSVAAASGGGSDNTKRRPKKSNSLRTGREERDGRRRGARTEAQRAARRGLAAREERKNRFKADASEKQRRRRKKRKENIQIDELFSLCKQLLREQETLRASVAKTRNYAGVPDSDRSDFGGSYTPDSRY